MVEGSDKRQIMFWRHWTNGNYFRSNAGDMGRGIAMLQIRKTANDLVKGPTKEFSKELKSL